MLVNAIGSAILQSAVNHVSISIQNGKVVTGSWAAVKGLYKLLARFDSSHLTNVPDDGLTYRAQTFEAMGRE
jgi:hypothetical protein